MQQKEAENKQLIERIGQLEIIAENVPGLYLSCMTFIICPIWPPTGHLERLHMLNDLYVASYCMQRDMNGIVTRRRSWRSSWKCPPPRTTSWHKSSRSLRRVFKEPWLNSTCISPIYMIHNLCLNTCLY